VLLYRLRMLRTLVILAAIALAIGARFAFG
jgi:hypothetical protein